MALLDAKKNLDRKSGDPAQKYIGPDDIKSAIDTIYADLSGGLPAFAAGDAQKLLRVKADGSAVEWVSLTTSDLVGYYIDETTLKADSPANSGYFAFADAEESMWWWDGAHWHQVGSPVAGGGGGTRLPADAAGVLTNDGAGILTWAAPAAGGGGAGTGVALPANAAGALVNDGAGGLRWNAIVGLPKFYGIETMLKADDPGRAGQFGYANMEKTLWWWDGTNWHQVTTGGGGGAPAAGGAPTVVATAAALPAAPPEGTVAYVQADGSRYVFGNDPISAGNPKMWTKISLPDPDGTGADAGKSLVTGLDANGRPTLTWGGAQTFYMGPKDLPTGDPKDIPGFPTNTGDRMITAGGEWSVMNYAAAKALYQEPLAKTWGNGGTPDVANAAALPAGGNTLGDVVVLQSTGFAYVWDGAAWAKKNHYDNTPEWVKEFDFGATMKADIKAKVAAAATWGDFQTAIAAW